MDGYEIRTFLLRVLYLVHPRYAIFAGRIADCNEALPLLYDKRYTRIKAKSDPFAGRIKRIAIAQCDDPQRVFHTKIMRMQMAVGDGWVKVVIVLGWCFVFAFPE